MSLRRRSARTRTSSRVSASPTTSCSTGWARTSTSATAAPTRTGEPYALVGVAGTAFAGWTGDLNAAGSAENQDHTGLLLTTSSFLAPDQFPLFASDAVVEFEIPGGPFDPHAGEWYVYSQQADETYKRLSRTVDMTGATTGELSFWTSYDTEAGLGLPVRRGPAGRHRRLDDAAGRQRAHRPGHRRQLP